MRRIPTFRRSTVRALVLTAMLGASGCSLPRWPLEAPMSSPYGLRLTGWWPDMHHGVDIPAPVGTPVRAMKAGRVAFAGVMRGYGNVVVLEHGGETTSLYAHLSELRVKAGDRVEGRQVIALSGQSGNARGAHLHFEVRRRGRSEDPVPLLGRAPGR